MKRVLCLLLTFVLLLGFAPQALADHVHQWTVSSRTEPTCTRSGVIVYVCYCGSKTRQSIPALGHEFSQQVYISQTDCTHYGAFYWVCERCGEHSATGNDKPLGHDWGEWQTVKPASQAEDGLEERICARCGEKETRTVAFDREAVRPVTYDNGADASEFLDRLRDDPPGKADPDDPLRIAMQPVGGYISYKENETLNLFVRAEGGVEPYTYQWREYLAWADYLGWTDMMPPVGYDAPQLTVSEGGKSYFCTVTDAAGESVASRYVAVNSELAIAEQPGNVNINGRESVTFHCRAVGGVPFYDSGYMYAWYKADGTQLDVTGEDFTVYEQGEYYCVAEDSEGNQVTSSTCKAYMGPKLDLTLSKDEIFLAAGEPYTAIAKISGGTAPYTAQWTLNDKPITTELNGMAAYAKIKGGESGESEYVCTVSDAMGETRNIVLFSRKLQIIEQPEGGYLSDDLNDPFQLHVVIRASASATPYTYVLRREGVDKRTEESDSKSYTFPVTEPGLYTIYVKDSEGNSAESVPVSVMGKVRIKSSTGRTDIPFLGQSAGLEVEAEGGEGPYTYRWVKQGWDNSFEKAHPEFVMRDEAETQENTFTVIEPFTYWRCIVTDKNNDTATTRDMGVGLKDPSLLITVQPENVELDYSKQSSPEAYLECRAAVNPGQKLSYTWQFKGDFGWSDAGSGETIKVGGEKKKRETLGIFRCKVTDEATGRYEYSREAVVSAKFAFTRAQQIGTTSRLEFEAVGGTAPYDVYVERLRYKESTTERHMLMTMVLLDEVQVVEKYTNITGYTNPTGLVVILPDADRYKKVMASYITFLWTISQEHYVKRPCSYRVMVTDKYGNITVSPWVECVW